MAAPLRCGAQLLKIKLRNRQVLRICAYPFRSSAPALASIEKLLIANRGEIACRVIRTARKLGVKTVAVYSEADGNAMHVDQADEAFLLGPAPSAESYLHYEKILKIAEESGSQAIHPGYGFLSENAEFADACQKQGIIFVGPPSSAIRDMGIKSTSKAIMIQANVPVIEGYHDGNQDATFLQGEAEKIGYPVMIKAIRGGGGKGMRIAMTAGEFLQQLESAKREAKKSFGNDDVLLEKFIEQPRHVEVQVFGDSHNNYVYVFERDCSVQRRHQKIIEEAPAPGISPEVRRSLGEAACRAAAAVNYIGAGTVEFIMDKNHKFYFMEMNTRLQVEHPVSEMISGTDLVEWQLKVAQGEELPMKQNDLKIYGHAIEARIYAEDPDNNFMPQAGPLHYLDIPSGPHVRVDTGVRQGDIVSVHYDPMIAKLVVWSTDRESALMKLNAALMDYHIVGLANNISFLSSLCMHPAFRAGEVHTGFIDQHYDQLFPPKKITAEILCQAALTVICQDEFAAIERTIATTDVYSPFSDLFGFGVNLLPRRRLEFLHGDSTKPFSVIVTSLAAGNFIMETLGNTYTVSGSLGSDGSLSCEINDKKMKSQVFQQDELVAIFWGNGRCTLQLPLPAFMQGATAQSAGSSGAVAPMPGVIEKVLVMDGDIVTEGDPLLVIIAMKMEYVIRAPTSGTVEKVLYNVGDNVDKSAQLIKFVDPAASTTSLNDKE